jgi:hypothetical protein
MRTLAANLETALNAGNEPYLQLQYCHNSGWGWHDAPYSIMEYKLGGLELTVRLAGHALFDAYAIRIKRGAYLNHVAYYETSSLYYVNSKYITQKDQVVLSATIFPTGTYKKYSVNGNQTYKQIIDAICTYFGYTATYETPADPIWSNIFYPAGRTLVLQSPHSFFTLLRQKLFIYAQDDNDNEIYFRQWIDDSLVGTGGHPSLETLTTFDWKEQYSLQYRLLMWRDEAATIHYYPDPAFYPTLPVYNLGYLESTATTPTSYQCWHTNEDKRQFHLKYQDGDIIACSSGTYQIKVYEIFDRTHSPSLYLQFLALPKFSTTEGGPLPSTIEAAAPYTPLNVSLFDGILGADDNNLQAAMNTIDDHLHPIYAVLAGVNTFAAAQFIDGSADAIQLRVQGHSTQTSNLVTFEKSDATVLGGIEGRGTYFCSLGIDANSLFIGSLCGKVGATGTENIVIGGLAFAHQSSGIDNIFIGYSAGRYATTGSYNVGIGAYALQSPYPMTGSNNFGLGYHSLFGLTSGNDNIAIGLQACSAVTTGSANIGIGRNSLLKVTTGQKNTSIGSYVGYNLTGSSNILLGYYCGYNQTTISNLFLIDNVQRADIATEVTNALVYGIMAALPANQTLAFNAVVSITDGLIVNEGGLATCDLRVETDNYDALFVDGSNDSIMIMSNAAGKIGHFGVAAVAQHAHIVDASDAGTVITVCNHILSVLEGYGLLAAA